MDKVDETGESVVITKPGKPVAKLVPAERERRNMWGDLVGTAKILGDIEAPVTNDGKRRDRSRHPCAGMAENLSRSALESCGGVHRKELKSDCVSIVAVTLWELGWLVTTEELTPAGQCQLL